MASSSSLSDNEDVPTQIVTFCLPPTQARQVVLELPLHYSVDQCMEAAGLHFQHAQSQCVLQQATPAPTAMLSERHIHPPPTSASMVRMFITTWISRPHEQRIEYLPKAWTVSALGVHLANQAQGALVFVFSEDRLLPYGMLLEDIPDDYLTYKREQDLCDEPTQDRVRRGGGKHARPKPEASSDAAKRQTMNGWAEGRIKDHVPSLDDRLVRTLLRSEGRITPAILQAKSPLQVQHVMIAALKRAGLHELARTIEEQPAHHATFEKPSGHQSSSTPSPTRAANMQDHLPMAEVSTSAEHPTPSTTQLVKEIHDMGSKVTQLSILAQHQYMAMMMMMMDWSPMVADTDRALGQINEKIDKLTMRIDKLHEEVQAWNQVYMDRWQSFLPPVDVLPPSAVSTPTYTDMEVEKNELVHDQEPKPNLPEEPVTPDKKASVVDAMSQRSLRSCCAKAVSSAQAPKALRPFKASA